MKTTKFYKCNVCGNVVVKLVDSGAPLVCCGKPMQELVPNTTDGATEKHLPVISGSKNKTTVAVGSTLHPMSPEHYINFIAVETSDGIMVANLLPNSLPKAEFSVDKSKVRAAYSYCNLHGLWKTEL